MLDDRRSSILQNQQMQEEYVKHEERLAENSKGYGLFSVLFLAAVIFLKPAVEYATDLYNYGVAQTQALAAFFGF